MVISRVWPAQWRQQHWRETVSIVTHLIDFFSAKLIGRSRMAWIRSRVDMSTSSLTRFCSSVTHKVKNNDFSVSHTSRNGLTRVETKLPFSISVFRASSVGARGAGSALGNTLILLIVCPLHLMLMFPVVIGHLFYSKLKLLKKNVELEKRKQSCYDVILTRFHPSIFSGFIP